MLLSLCLSAWEGEISQNPMCLQEKSLGSQCSLSELFGEESLGQGKGCREVLCTRHACAPLHFTLLRHCAHTAPVTGVRPEENTTFILLGTGET